MMHPFSAPHARPTLLTLTAVMAALLILVPAGNARAACVSSTPASQSFPDATGDALIGAPEILSIDVSLDAACRLTVDPKLQSPLGPSQSMSIQMGFALDELVDREVIVTSGPAPLLLDGSGLPVGPLSHYGQAGFTATLDQIGLPEPASLGLYVVSAGLNAVYDEAPTIVDPMFRFPVDFSSTPPPPPSPPVQPPAPPAPAAPAAPAAKPVTGCVVPKLKGLTVKKAKAALKKAGCKYKLKGKGRVRSFSPKAGTRTAGTVQVKCKQKRRKKKRSRRAVLVHDVRAAAHRLR